MSKSIRLLIVAPEPIVRKFLKTGLEPIGYLIEEAATAEEGLEKVISFKPELIILDLCPPEIDGFDFLRRLGQSSKTPVMVLSMLDSDSDKVKFLEAGADDYLTKPLSIPVLSARLRVAVRHYLAPQESAPYFKSSKFEISRTDQAVKFDGKYIKLTSTEYKLLRILAQGQGRVVTQQQLVDEIWGPKGSRTAHYLRVYIGHLRKKLETDPNQPSLIFTEPGVGYRLNVEALW